jgi:hypothetical protein
MNRKKIENFNLRRSEDLCKLVEELDYRKDPKQLQCNNGAYVSSLLHFFDDNPGAMEAVREWAADNHSEEYEEDESEIEVEDPEEEG